jgi:branched-chain amino acid transport system permease protein
MVNARCKLISWLIRHSILIGIILALFLLPLILKNAYILRILIFAGIYVILVSSLNLVNGYTGLFSLGHAAFYGIGAYTSAIVVMRLGFPIWLGMIAAALIAAFFGYLIAHPTTRLTGTYLSLATLGFNIIIMLVFLNWDALTRGPLGIAGIPAPSFLGQKFLSPVPYYYLILVLAFLTIFCLNRLVHSRFGLALKAIREDEQAAAANGINLVYYKVAAFIIAAGIAGIAGSFYAHYMMYISPDTFSQLEAFAILTMLAFGGPGNLVGPVVGAVGLTCVTEVFRSFGDFRMITYGVLLVLMMLFRREGLLGGKEYTLILTWPPQKKELYMGGDKFLTKGEAQE